MRKYLLLLLLVFALFATHRVSAQQTDTFMMVRLKEVEVKGARKWMNDTARYRFNQMRFNVQTILPYMEAATKTFSEVNAKIHQEAIGKKERKDFIHSKENELRTDFEDRVKALNETQGVLLIKLIARQTGANIYSILKEFKNPLTAIKWQAWAKLNGFNLNKKYNPNDEPLLEQVMLNLGYELPPFYDTEETATAMKRQ
ncbi:MAG TPA: DUF4294 domain-containing protein [Flavipsychrobacter sp.]|nr:DUF4294 domain-containing protein [Flavipsychrobacter sp.]